MKKLFLLLFLLLAIPGLGHAWDVKLSCTSSGPDTAIIYGKKSGNEAVYAVKIGAGPYYEFKVGPHIAPYVFYSKWVRSKGRKSMLSLKFLRGDKWYFEEWRIIDGKAKLTGRTWTMGCKGVWSKSRRR